MHASMPPVVPAKPCAFERMVKQLGLHAGELVYSLPLREWAQRNKDYRYVPEALLEAWGLTVSVRTSTDEVLRRNADYRAQRRAVLA
jgi:hypothetical protein